MSGGLTCTSCGKAVAAGDRFCAGCGTAVTVADETVVAGPAHDVGTNPTQCVQCGSSMGRDDRFCPSCGSGRPEAPTVVSHVSLRNAQATRLIEATRGEFEVLEQLGTGAMGAVYLAKDVALGRKVAIKVIAPHLLSDETMISRFRMEAQTVASLRHPNIVNVHAVRQSEDLHYFVMEFIDGPPLRSLVKGHAPLDVDVVQSIIFQVGSALSYAHRSRGGVIHRDVKPANIMVDREGDAFVTDFGISKIAEAQTGLTQTGATIGTPEYMSPEQCRGDVLTGASDQYALGIVAYEMLCGGTPFGGTQYHIMVAHTTEVPKAIRDVRPDVPAHVAEAVERMLAKAPEDRWPDLDAAVMAMGGSPLGYHDPIRQKIKALTGATLTHVPAVGTGSRSGGASGGRATLDTATSVTVLGVPAVLETGERIHLQADVRGTGNTSLSGQGIVWASTDPSIAKVEGGWVEGIRPGSVSIMASAGQVASSVVLTVSEPLPAKLVVRPTSVRMQSGGVIGLSAVVQDKRGRTLEREIRWSSSDTGVATVSETGQVRATGSGDVEIVAETDGASGSAAIAVEVPATAPHTSVTGSAGATSVAPPEPMEAAAAAVAPAPPKAAPRQTTAPKPRPPARSTEARPAYRNPLALVAALVVLVGVGVVGVRTIGGGGGAVVDPVPSSFPTGTSGAGGLGPEAALPGGGPGGSDDATSVEPGPSTPSTGGTEPSSTPEIQPASPPPTQPAGRGGGAGPTGGRGSAASATPAPTPARLAVALPSSSMRVGGTQSASAQVFASGGAPMGRGSYTLSWRSSDASVLSVDPRSGAVRGAAPGTAWVVGTAGNARDSVRVSVAATVSAVRIAEPDFALETGAPDRSLTASVLDSSGDAMRRTVAWASSDDRVARVDATGRVSAVGPGTTQITASADGFSDRVTVTVTQPAAAPPATPPAAPATTPAATPSADEARTAVEAYVTALAQGDRDLVTRLWGSADADRRDEVLDLMGENAFSAQLGAVGSPSPAGTGASITFQVRAAWRSNFGQNRNRDLTFLGRLERVGSEWQLASSVAQ